MKVAERHKKILTLIKWQPCTIDDLAITLAVSPVTVRRDLSRLAEQGLLTRTLGSAATSADRTERSLKQRVRFAKEEKRRIAQAAATHVRPRQTLFLDSGTSAGALADDIGATEPSQTRLKELVMLKSAHTIALGHADKLNRTNTHHWAAMPIGTIIITDVKGANMAEVFQQNGYTLVSV